MKPGCEWLARCIPLACQERQWMQPKRVGPPWTRQIRNHSGSAGSNTSRTSPFGGIGRPSSSPKRRRASRYPRLLATKLADSHTVVRENSPSRFPGTDFRGPISGDDFRGFPGGFPGFPGTVYANYLLALLPHPQPPRGPFRWHRQANVPGTGAASLAPLGTSGACPRAIRAPTGPFRHDPADGKVTILVTI